MTDITELAQRLKASAEKATPGPWEVQFDDEIYATDSVDNEQVAIATLDARDADYIALANPANVLALVEALEKAQETIAFQQGEIKALLSSLESRTVKLPKRHSMLLREDFNEDYHTEMAYKADEVHASLTAAGIKVEAEMKIRIVLQELKEEGVLTTYSNGHIEMLPYRIDENGEEYVEMFPNDIEQH